MLRLVMHHLLDCRYREGEEDTEEDSDRPDQDFFLACDADPS